MAVQPKFVRPTAQELDSALVTLRSTFQKNNVRYVDYRLFCGAITAQFEAIPDNLLECLYKGLAAEKSSRISVANFLEIVEAVFGDHPESLLQLIFGVYDVRSANSVERLHIEWLLGEAYGSEYTSGGVVNQQKEEDNTNNIKRDIEEKDYVKNVQPLLDQMFSVRTEVKTVGGRRSSRDSGEGDGPQVGTERDPNSITQGAKVASVTAVVNKKKSKIRFSEFKQYEGDLTFLSDWILTVMSVFISSPSPRLLRNEKRYSAAVETEEMVARYGESKASIDRLRQIFYARCGSSKAELTLDLWVDWVVSYMTVDLAAALFRAKSRNFKLTWRFADFAEFCMIFGAGSLEDKALALCKMFYTAFVGEQQQQQIDAEIAMENHEMTIEEIEVESEGDDEGEGTGTVPDTPGEKRAKQKKLQAFLHSMRAMVLLLARSYDPLQAQPEPPRFSANLSSLSEHVPLPSARRRSLSDVSSADIGGNHSGKKPSLGVVDKKDAEKYVCTLEELEESTFLPSAVRETLGEIEQAGREDEETLRNPALLLQRYIDLVVNHESNLPGLRELSMTSCCLFGVRPPAPHLEKEYVMEIMMRRQAEFPQTSTNPFGPEDTEWCIISKAWWDSWRFYVGKIRQPSGRERERERESQSPKGHGRSESPERLVPEPKAIDNWAILKRSGAKQLQSGISMGQHLEVVPPAVYASVYAWYGGGPRVIRKVVPIINAGKDAEGVGSSHDSEAARQRRMSRPPVLTELELFPLNLRVCTCDSQGKTLRDHKDFLFSKTATVAEATQELCDARKIGVGKTRLWNYAATHWKEQYILSPEMTLIEARLQDNQDVLMEISGSNGAWPRSQLHADLEEEELSEEAGGAADNGDEGHVVSSVSGKHSLRINSGKVGLDNLGNTCYMNSSLQALVHTEPLVSYFLAKQHVKHVNVANRDGHQGRLAYYFGRLSTEMWTTNKSALSPRQFCSEVGYLNAQFRGHQQQDAQELIDFLLGGLSEDLNLVESKPYTEQPDSDGRPDSELADIWWANHQKRELSIVQALFAGQFKSTRRCACGYTSARYEPFTLLNLPIPEDVQRVMTVHVFTRGVSFGTKLSVIVDKDGTLLDVINAFLSPSFQPPLQGLSAATPPSSATKETRQPPPRTSSSAFFFVAAEVSSSRIKATCKLSRRLRTIRENDNIFFFEVVRESTADRGARERREAKMRALRGAGNEQSGGVDTVTVTGAGAGDRSEGAEGSMFRVRNSSDEEEESDDDDDDDDDNQAAASEREGGASTEPEDVKVCFVQRKARLGEGGGAVESFYMTVFGLPQLEVVPNVMTGAELYCLIGARVAAYLGGRPGLVRRLAMTYGAGFEEAFGKASAAYFMGPVRPMSIDEAVGGPIPPRGFVLRLIEGKESAGGACSECHWMSRCSGCLVPDDDTSISLKDGQTIAIDWHMIVFEEMVDTAAIMKIHNHESASHDEGSRLMPGLPLSHCFRKFAETESLEGCVCPKCLEDDRMVRHDELWRLPPVLVVQLKRFQWSLNDRTSRRKLTNKIDFPIDGLDLAEYIAPSKRVESKLHGPPEPGEQGGGKGSGEGEGEEEGPGGLPLTIEQPNHPSDSSLGCTQYDLYAAVHHVGVLGGGHYVCTVREGARPRAHSHNGSHNGSGSGSGGRRSQGSTTSSGDRESSGNGPAGGDDRGVGPSSSVESLGSLDADTAPAHALSDRWFVYNDGQVTPLQDSREVSASTAYVLFYLRRDARTKNLSALFPQADTFKVDRSRDFVFKERPSARKTLRDTANKAAGFMSGWRGKNKVRGSSDDASDPGEDAEDGDRQGRGRAPGWSSNREGCVVA